jgi:hypothetical protein
MIIVSGASNNHYFTLIQFIESFIFNKVDSKLIIYNLGINEDKWLFLKKKYSIHNFIFKNFNYEIYPEWFNININRGEYAWKPAIIYEVFNEYMDEIIVWMDSGNIIVNNLKELFAFIEKNGIHSGNTSGNIQQWCHPNTMKILECHDNTKPNRNGACMGFNTKISWVQDFIRKFYLSCSNKNIIAPDGSNRTNHRQDQAVFTILFYKYLNEYNFNVYENTNWNNFLGYTIHNDIGGSDNPR